MGVCEKKEPDRARGKIGFCGSRSRRTQQCAHLLCRLFSLLLEVPGMFRHQQCGHAHLLELGLQGRYAASSI